MPSGDDAAARSDASLTALELMVRHADMATLAACRAVDRAWQSCVSVALKHVGIAIVHIQHGYAELGLSEIEHESEWESEQFLISDKGRSWLPMLLQRPQRRNREGGLCPPGLRFAMLRSRRQLRAAQDVAAWVAAKLQQAGGGLSHRRVVVVAPREVKVALLAAEKLSSAGLPVTTVATQPLSDVLDAVSGFLACVPPLSEDAAAPEAVVEEKFDDTPEADPFLGDFMGCCWGCSGRPRAASSRVVCRRLPLHAQ
eukprot:TRINITY_DN92899_c0_g1_i1.p2 TRINITY_DN92899_c0_g1~~TRINITY_DN92899_c0_g1_i1.p2  ORF type:complete len:256 (+),score=66.70 TRINITY_DN92899_c0_g1_i1:139-906(+)